MPFTRFSFDAFFVEICTYIYIQLKKTIKIYRKLSKTRENHTIPISSLAHTHPISTCISPVFHRLPHTHIIEIHGLPGLTCHGWLPWGEFTTQQAHSAETSSSKNLNSFQIKNFALLKPLIKHSQCHRLTASIQIRLTATSLAHPQSTLQLN